MKASFFKRLFAYIIDSILISIFISIITVSFNTNKLHTLDEHINKVTTNYVSGNISVNKYVSEYENYIYHYQNSSILINSIGIAIYIAYFIIFQYLNKGQTIGKKICKIKVTDKNKNNPSFANILVRSIFLYGMLSLIYAVGFISFLSMQTYSICYIIISGLEGLFVFISAIVILYSKNKLGLHDMMAGTIVIESSR